MSRYVLILSDNFEIRLSFIFFSYCLNSNLFDLLLYSKFSSKFFSPFNISSLNTFKLIIIFIEYNMGLPFLFFDVTVFTILVFKFRSNPVDIFSLFKLLKFIGNSKPDIILSTLPTPNLMVIILKKLKLINSKVVLREANSNYLNWQNGLLNKIKGQIAIFAFNNSDTNIFISQELQTSLEKIISNRRNITIYNPVLVDNFFEKSLEEVLDFKKPNSELWVTTSRLEHQKGLDLLFEAAYKFLGKRKFSILVVGDGSQELHYKKIYSDLPITFIGNTQNPIKYLNLADIFFFPSRREGLGNSLIEAQILGKNIITSDCPSGPKEIIDVFNNGMLFESENIDKLIEAINNLELSDNKNVNKEIINQFSIEKISSEYYSLINKLI